MNEDASPRRLITFSHSLPSWSWRSRGYLKRMKPWWKALPSGRLWRKQWGINWRLRLRGCTTLTETWEVCGQLKCPGNAPPAFKCDPVCVTAMFCLSSSLQNNWTRPPNSERPSVQTRGSMSSLSCWSKVSLSFEKLSSHSMLQEGGEMWVFIWFDESHSPVKH